MDELENMQFNTSMRYEDDIVRDHRVHQVRMMPGVTFIDMIYRLLKKKGFQLDNIELKEILFQEPISVAEDYDRKINISFEKNQTYWNVTAKSIKTKNGEMIGSAWDDNFQCEIHMAKSPLQNTLDIKQLKQEANDVSDMDSAYELARRIKIDHYEFMKGLGSIYQGSDYLLAEIHLGTLAEKYLEYFYLHPAYLDSSTLVQIKYAKIDPSNVKPFIPIYIESFRAFDTLKQKCYVFVKQDTVTLSNSKDVMYSNIELYDENGTITAVFQKLASKQIRAKELVTKQEKYEKQPVPESKKVEIKLQELGTEEDLQKLIEEDVKQMVAEIQKKDADSVSVDQGFYDQGLDSADLLLLVRMLEKRIGEQLYPTLLFEYTNVTELAQYLCEEFGETYREKKAPVATGSDSDSEHHSKYYYEFVKRRSDLTFLPSHPKMRGVAVLFGAYDVCLDSFLGEDSLQVLKVRSGDSFQQLKEDEFVLNLQSEQYYNDFMETLNRKGIVPDYFVNVYKEETVSLSDHALQQKMKEVLLPAFYLMKSVMKGKFKKSMQFLYCFEQKAEYIHPLSAAIQGFLKTAHIENGKLSYKFLHIKRGGKGDIASTILKELATINDEEFEVRYEEKVRYVNAAKRMEMPSEKKAVLKQKGVYVITGGLGGLGQIFSKYLGKRYNARLVLTGRGELDERKEAQIQELESCGAEILYVPADICNRDDVNYLMEQIRSRYETVDGVLHCAGIVKDSLIINKTEEEFLEVTAPKIWGTMYLDEAFQEHSLDFFVMFSSTTSVLGNSGQSDYALGNSFMDNFARVRERLRSEKKRFGRTLSINWSYWDHGGMNIDDASRKYMMEEIGVVPLSDESGVEAFEALISKTQSSQCVVVEGNREKIGAIFHEVSDEQKQMPKQIKEEQEEDQIAVIGINGRYPMAENIHEFWENLASGKDCISEIPKERWDHTRYFDADQRKEGKSYSKWGGFLRDVDKFSPLFFHMSPKEAKLVDPQERLFLETVWNTIEDAGYTRAMLSKKTGVFVGVMWGEYQLLRSRAGETELSPNAIFASIANRVSYFFNLNGPSMALDTMCSSSLTSIHLACESIRRGECETAIAGGVNLSIHPNKYLFLSRQKFASSDGRCRSFGENGDGYVPGEGVGALLLKPLKKAVSDGDFIYGLIAGSALNHGGKTSGYTVPNPKAQAQVIDDALKASSIDPRTISYVEAHGTGTSLGDPIEIKGITNAYRRYTKDRQFCAMASVKSNIGHLESASGVAGVTKVLMQMKHKKLVPSIHCETLNPNIDLEASPFYIQHSLEEWKKPEIEIDGVRKEYPRRAGISSFGAGGSNAHLILEEYKNIPFEMEEHPELSRLFVLSAEHKEQLKERARQLKKFVEQSILEEPNRLSRVAYTLQIGREEMEERVAVIATNGLELIQKLSAFIQGSDSEGVITGCEMDTEINYEEPQAERLARAYAAGKRIDWNKLYKDKSYQKETLPGYPFQGERYWISEDSDRTVSGGTCCDVLHPLIDTNISTLQEQVFQKTLRREEFVIEDHRILGQMILPGSAHLEMARAASSIAAKGEVNSISDIVWMNPLIVEGDSLELFISLYPVGSKIEYEIYSGQEEHRHIYSKGAITMENRGEVKADRKIRLDLHEITEKSQESMKKEEIYSAFHRLGFEYGTGFQVTQHLYCGETSALAELKLPKELLHTSSQYGLHPSLLDGAFRATAGVGGSKGELKLPFALEEVKIYKPLTEHCYAYAVMGDKEHQYNISIVDENGEALAQITGFSTRIYQRQNSQQHELKLSYYQPYWKKSALNTEPCTSDHQKEGKTALVIFADPINDAEEFLAAMNPNLPSHITKIRVKRGEAFRAERENTYTIDSQNAEHYHKLFNQLKGEGYHIGYIAHLCHGGNTNGKSIKGLDDGLYPVLYTFQAVNALKQQAKTRCLIAFAGNGSRGAPIYEAINGFANSLTIVNHRFELITVEHADVPNETIWTNIGRELLERNNKNGDEIRFYHGERYRRCIQKMVKQYDGELKIKNKGVYLITGGLGGLGLTIAQSLAKEHQAKLVLLGRSVLNDAGRAKISKLKEAGAEVLYVQADVSDQEQLKAAALKVKLEYGEINGIIHSAGTTGDTLVTEVNREEFDRVIASKVIGTMNLDQVFREEPLDFFALFSSISALIGDFGGCSYAYGNSYLDRYAVMRNRCVKEGTCHGRTVSINWTLWDAGGMELPLDEAKSYFDYSGMYPISGELGLQIFQDVLTCGNENQIAVYGDTDKIEKVLKVDKAGTTVHNLDETDEEVIRTTNESKSSHSYKSVEEYLKKILSGIISYPEAKINAKLPMERYGIDSVMIMEFNAILEEDFKQLSKTLLFEYKTLSDLAAYLVENHKEEVNERFGNVEHVKIRHKKKEVQRPRFAQEGIAKKSEPVKEKKHYANEDIAIIGLNGCFPGADNMDEFWDVLAKGTDCITEIPKSRWDYKKYYSPEKGTEGKAYSKWGGFINGFDKFDALLFHISPKEAELMDPQERKFLEVVRNTMEDAGYTRKALESQKVGVFAGVMFGNYQLYGLENMLKQKGAVAGSFFSSIANRVSYFMNFSGPSMAVDTACSSSLEAIRLACQNIMDGTCDMAVAGGVNLILHPHKYVVLCQNNFLSTDGRCRSFGEGGDGYVPGEGAGAVLLKPLKKALQDNDQIYGVIKGISVNHGGKTNGYTVPNPNAQAKLIEETLQKSCVDPRTISYIETHGTGTALGDPIEISGLHKAFHDHLSHHPGCSIGSIKSNIGHLESAAGIAGVMKVLMQMKHKKLVPSLHSNVLNPNIDFTHSPFHVQQELEEWEQPLIVEEHGEFKAPRRAGLSAFGAGGTNVHMILEEYNEEQDTDKIVEEPMLFVLSARNESLLKIYARNIAGYLVKRNLSEEPITTKDVSADLRKILSELLKVNEDDIDLEECFEEYGMDLDKISLFVQKVNEEYETELSISGFSIHSTPGRIAETLSPEYTNQINRMRMEGDLDKGSHIDLRRMSYTLQVGREAMDERLAVIAKNREELVAKLDCYIDGGSTEEIFAGNRNNERNTSDLLLDSEEGMEFIENIVKTSKLDKIARIWIAGIEINWEILYGGDLPKRMSLPCYPLERKRYWLPQAEEELFPDSEQSKQRPLADLKEQSKSISITEQLEHTLRSMVTRVLKISEKELNVEKGLTDYGFDSLTGMNIVNTLKELYGEKISLQMFFQHSSIRKISQHLIREGIISSENIDLLTNERNTLCAGQMEDFNHEKKTFDREYTMKLLKKLQEKTIDPKQAMELKLAIEEESMGKRGGK